MDEVIYLSHEVRVAETNVCGGAIEATKQKVVNISEESNEMRYDKKCERNEIHGEDSKDGSNVKDHSHVQKSECEVDKDVDRHKGDNKKNIQSSQGWARK